MSGQSNGTGVYGLGGAFGVHGQNTALKVEGKLSLSRAGALTIAKGAKSSLVKFDGIASSSWIIASIQSASGTVAIANVIPATSEFAINLTGAAPETLKVAWFAIG